MPGAGRLLVAGAAFCIGDPVLAGNRFLTCRTSISGGRFARTVPVISGAAPSAVAASSPDNQMQVLQPAHENARHVDMRARWIRRDV